MSTEPIDLDALRRQLASVGSGVTETDLASSPFKDINGAFEELRRLNEAYDDQCDGSMSPCPHIGVDLAHVLLGEVIRQAAEIERLATLLGEQADHAMAEGWNRLADEWDQAEVPVTVQWAAEFRRLDGRVERTLWGDDESFAVAEAGAFNEWVASLNEATRKERGVESARPVRREVRRFPDGSRLIGPWKPVEPATGEVEEISEEEAT